MRIVKLIDEALAIAQLFSGIGINFGKLKSNILEFRAFVLSQRDAEIMKSRIDSKKIENEIIEKQLPNRETLLFIAYDRAGTKDLDDSIKDIAHNEVDFSNKYLDANRNGNHGDGKGKESRCRKIGRHSKEI